MCAHAVIRMQQYQIFNSRSTCFQPKILSWKVLEVRKKRWQTHWIFSFLLKHKHPQQFQNILHSSGSWVGRRGEIPRTPPEWHYVQLQPPFIISSLKTIVILPFEAEAAQPHIFFLFCSRLAQLCENHSQPGCSVVIPCDHVLFPLHQVTKQINMFTVTHVESSLFWLKEGEDLTLSPSLSWKASRTSSGFASPILWKGDLSVSIWLKKFLTTLCVAGPT